MPESTEFRVSDFVVISFLWMIELVNYWLISLSQYTSQVVYPNENFRSAYFSVHETWIFFMQCFAIVGLAVYVDAYDHKYITVFSVLCSCLAIPFIAVAVCITTFAPATVLLFFSVSGIYVVSPATYCLIFNQNLDPSRKAARRLVMVFEISEILIGKYLVFLCIPESASGAENENLVLIVDWVILTPLLITLITLIDRAKKFVTGDFVRERGIKRILQGIQDDMVDQPSTRRGRSPLHVTFFVLLLLPALTLTIVDVALSNANSDDEARAQSPTLKHIVYGAQIMTIPVSEIIVTFLPVVKETTSEMLCLGMAHVGNIVVLTLLIFQMDYVPDNIPTLNSNFRTKRETLRQGGQYCAVNCEIPPPTPGWAAFVFFNAAPQPVTIENDPPVFFKIKTAGLFTFIRGKIEFPPNQTSINVKLSATFQTGSTPHPTTTNYITIHEKKYYIYFVSGNSTDVKCIEVNGTDDVPQKAAPQLIFVNSFAEDVVDDIPVLNYNEYQINSIENKFDEYYTFPAVGKYDVIDLPVGDVQITYAYLGSNEHLNEVLGTDSLVIPTEPFGIYISLLGRKEKIHLYMYKANILPNTTTTTTTTMKPVEIKEPDTLQKSSYAVLGATLGIATVGYTHFLWVESPVRMRALIIAGFRVSTSLVGWITEKVVGDTFTRPKAIILLLLQVVTTIWHLVLSWIFEARIKQDN